MEDERVELALDDQNRVSRLVGHKVAVVLGNGAGMVATLEEVRDDGIVLSEIDELGPGPKLFCTWDSLRRLREPYFVPPHEVPESDEYYELYEHREVPPGEVAPELLVERRRDSARNLQRVAPIAQRRTVGGITVALTSLELFGEGVGVLRYRISYEAGVFEASNRFAGVPEPEFVISDGSGRELPWAPQAWGGSESEADGDVGVSDLPEAGELEVEVPRLVRLVFDDETGEERVEGSRDGPWSFRFAN